MERSERVRLRKSSSKRKRRAARREFARTLCTVDKHAYDIHSWAQTRPDHLRGTTTGVPSSRPTRKNRRIFTTVRCQYDSSTLMTIGYGLQIVHEMDGDVLLGYGLKTLVDICKGSPITQYEGEILSSIQAAAIHGSDPSRSSHFATPVKGGPVINGFQRLPHMDNQPPTDRDHEITTDFCEAIGASGDPLLLSYGALKGKGGGSFANHRSRRDGLGPNAEFEPDRFIGKNGTRDETVLILIAIREIPAGEFIRVSYGDMFTTSNKTNL
jgi:hypothetical protein